MWFPPLTTSKGVRGKDLGKGEVIIFEGTYVIFERKMQNVFLDIDCVCN